MTLKQFNELKIGDYINIEGQIRQIGETTRIYPKVKQIATGSIVWDYKYVKLATKQEYIDYKIKCIDKEIKRLQEQREKLLNE